MNNTINIERRCDFCGESFLVLHENRKYCPEKHEIKNFCSNRNKSKKYRESQVNRIVNFIKDPTLGVIDSNFSRIENKFKNMLILLDLGKKKIRYRYQNRSKVPYIVDINQLLKDGFNFLLFDQYKRDENGVYKIKYDFVIFSIFEHDKVKIDLNFKSNW